MQIDSEKEIVTRCPQCKTAFRVTKLQLAVAKGAVRCGSCLAVFKAEPNAVDQPKPSLLGSNLKQKPQSNSQQFVNDLVQTVSPESKAKLVSEVKADLSSSSADIPLGQQKTNAPQVKTRFSQDSGSIFNDDVPIEDEEESIDFDENIYDLDKDSKSSHKKISLFDSRAEKPISKQTRESADESWALDMLADLEDDDDIQPIKVRPKNKKPVESLPESERQASVSVDPEPEAEFIEKPDSEIHGLETKLDGLSSFNDEPFDHGDDILEFDADHYGDEEEESYQSDEVRDDESFMAEGEQYISEEAIENAMHTRTSYVSDQKGYLASIDPGPVEMIWQEAGLAKRWLWPIGAIFLGALLILQIAIFRFDTLSKNATYRPYYEFACQYLDCQLSPLEDFSKIKTTNLVVRSHPSESNALIIDAIIVNGAEYSQRFPQLRLTFSDLNNQLIAGRDLNSADYLKGELLNLREMPSNQPLQISLEIRDPGDNAVNYQLSVIGPSK